MPRRSSRFLAVLAAFALQSHAPAQAAPRPLSDNEMRAVRGADGSIAATIQTSSGDSQNALGSGLAAAFASSTGATPLTPAQFAEALATLGLTPASFADYAGQTVTQTVVDAKPVTFSFKLSDVLQSGTGLRFTSTPGGPSMGTITLHDFDARGTTIWVWQH